MLWVCGDGEQGLGGDLEQNVRDHCLVVIGDVGDGRRHGLPRHDGLHDPLPLQVEPPDETDPLKHGLELDREAPDEPARTTEMAISNLTGSKMTIQARAPVQGQLSPTSAYERKVVEALTKGLVNKILHSPTTALRAPQPRSQRRDSMQALERLFELDQAAE